MHVQAYYNGLQAGMTTAMGYPVAVAVPAARSSNATMGDVERGWARAAPTLSRVATITAGKVTGERAQRRSKMLAEWEAFASDFPAALRPELRTCRPLDVMIFLDEWRAARRGRSGGANARGEERPIAPGTLRGASSLLHGIFQDLGRYGPWEEEKQSGNPLEYGAVRNYVEGYERYAFEELDYNESLLYP